MKKILLAITLAAAAGCAGIATHEDYDAKATAMLKASFKEHGQAKLDRLDQDEVQKACSGHDPAQPLDKALGERIEKSQLATIKYPAGNLLGDWKNGDKIAH